MSLEDLEHRLGALSLSLFAIEGDSVSIHGRLFKRQHRAISRLCNHITAGSFSVGKVRKQLFNVFHHSHNMKMAPSLSVFQLIGLSIIFLYLGGFINRLEGGSEVTEIQNGRGSQFFEIRLG